MREKGLNLRLMSAVGFVRQGAVFADIGTDHAYLPLFLLSEGRIERAVLSDINEGPLESARRNARASGYADRVELILTDGASALADKGITDYAICGMGGELIADIIDRAPEMRDPKVRLILQPMTRRGALVSYLYNNGFAILSEAYSRDAGKYYVTLHAAFVGECREIDPVEAELGSIDIPCINSEARLGYLRAKLAVFEKRRAGVEMSSSGGEDYTPHLEHLKKLINFEERR
jgi:tRNA (adenine22-N1)-methyltransferase